MTWRTTSRLSGVRMRWEEEEPERGAGRAGGSFFSSATMLPARPLRRNSLWAALNCSLFLPKNRRARASSFWRKTVFSRRDCSRAWRVCSKVCRKEETCCCSRLICICSSARFIVCQSDDSPFKMFKLFCDFTERSFYALRGALIPRPARPVLQIHPVQQQLQGLRGQTDFGPGLSRALWPVKGPLFQPFGQDADARAVKIKNLDPVV